MDQLVQTLDDLRQIEFQQKNGSDEGLLGIDRLKRK
jgi:hypothetical protein